MQPVNCEDNKKMNTKCLERYSSYFEKFSRITDEDQYRYVDFITLEEVFDGDIVTPRFVTSREDINGENLGFSCREITGNQWNEDLDYLEFVKYMEESIKTPRTFTDQRQVL